MRKFFVTFGGVALILVGCGSFNNSFNTYSGIIPNSQNQVPKSSEPEIVVGLGEETKTVPTPPAVQPSTPPVSVQEALPEQPCPVEAYTAWPKAPDLPLKQLQDAGDDIRMIERIERKHIDDLRLYISKIRHQNNGRILDFAAKCKAVVK